jgi:Ca2+/Na+ antiporter
MIATAIPEIITTLPISRGGTGATTATAALTALGGVGSNITGITGATQLTNMMQITQAGYNAISPLTNTLYIIVG